ncbi:MAG: ABC transporter ATP-binding protein [Clostridiales bacterium]|nr:ABC transporter ATP-binding protein [Clostridiales bacterium]
MIVDKQENTLDITRNSEELLKIENLSVEYRASGAVAKAVNGMNLTIHQGEALGIVGESGAGKTTTALSIMNLLPDRVGFVTSGEIYFHGKPMSSMKEKELNEIRGKNISMVFANPLTALNPLYTVGHQIAMSIIEHENISKNEAEKRAEKLLEMVGIAPYRAKNFPHEFSGGMRQRVGIAAALACSPELLLADEPTTALDVTIQAQILELMKNLQKEYSTALVMITHNLGIIAELCQTVAVMYGGRVVEYGSVEEVFTNPKHFYTYGLLHAIPNLSGPRNRLESIPGLVANAQNLPDGCKFHPRCAHCTERCKKEEPLLMKVSENHYAACWEMEG